MITLYSTPTCSQCAQVKAFLNKQHIDFKQIDVSQDKEAAKEMIDLTNQMGVPVVRRGDAFVVGYDPLALKAFLEA